MAVSQPDFSCYPVLLLSLSPQVLVPRVPLIHLLHEALLGFRFPESSSKVHPEPHA